MNAETITIVVVGLVVFSGAGMVVFNFQIRPLLLNYTRNRYAKANGLERRQSISFGRSRPGFLSQGFSGFKSGFNAEKGLAVFGVSYSLRKIFPKAVGSVSKQVEILWDDSIKLTREFSFISTKSLWMLRQGNSYQYQEYISTYSFGHIEYLKNYDISVPAFISSKGLGMSIGPWGVLVIAPKVGWGNYDRILQEWRVMKEDVRIFVAEIESSKEFDISDEKKEFLQKIGAM